MPPRKATKKGAKGSKSAKVAAKTEESVTEVNTKADKTTSVPTKNGSSEDCPDTMASSIIAIDSTQLMVEDSEAKVERNVLDSLKNVKSTNDESRQVSSSKRSQQKHYQHRKVSSHGPVTVADMLVDPITQLAAEHWASKPTECTKELYNEELVKDIYKKEMSSIVLETSSSSSNPSNSRMQLLEVSGYLENYLWPYFAPELEVGLEHKVSMLLIINEKYRSGLSAFEELSKDPARCQRFYEAIVDLFLDPGQLEAACTAAAATVSIRSGGSGGGRGRASGSTALLVQYVTFIINSFRSIENPVVRQCTLRYVSLPLWEHLSRTRLQQEVTSSPALAAHWQSYSAQKAGAEGEDASSSGSGSRGKDPGISSAGKKAAKKTSATAGGKRKRKGLEPTAGVGAGDSSDAAVQQQNAQKALAAMRRDSQWLPSIIASFLDDIASPSPSSLPACSTSRPSKPPAGTVKFYSRVLELLIDLLSQIPTRRFLKILLEDVHFVLICKQSSVLRELNNTLLQQLVEMVDAYMHFEVDDHSGEALTWQQMLERSAARINELQQVAYRDFPDELRDLVFSSVGELSKREHLLRHIQLLESEQLLKLGKALRIVTDTDENITSTSTAGATGTSDVLLHGRRWLNLRGDDGAFLRDLLLEHLVPRARQIDALNMMPLYPSEQLLWDRHQLPLSSFYNGDEVLALPKLNVQFLTIHDYLLRNFTLFRLESAYEVRDDICDAVRRMGPKRGLRGDTSFVGWARMALPIATLSIDEVSKPRLGEHVPRHVDCTVTVDISRFSGEMRAEWEELKEFDVLFLVCIDRPEVDPTQRQVEYDRQKQLLSQGRKPEKRWREMAREVEAEDFVNQYGVRYVRGGTIFEVRDEANVVLNDPTRPDERKGGRAGSKRKLRMHLDPSQYYEDMKNGVNCYESLNLVVRRKPKENNFKPILETIRSLINTAAVGRAIPSWLHDVFLGYGKPSSANYRTIMASGEEENTYGDTFLDPEHVIEAFPQAENISFEDNDSGAIIAVRQKGHTQEKLVGKLPPPPYRLTIRRARTSSAANSSSSSSDGGDGTAAKKKSKKSSGRATTANSSGGGGRGSAESSGEGIESILVKAVRRPNPGPYPEDQPPRNTVRFTPTQVEAIRSGMNPGLTMVVGPPGTGKTDTAVQIITNLYHNYPTQKILLVTHSNAALNDLFEKIMERDVAPRHLLRLGSGEAELRETLAVAGAKGGGRGQGEAFSKQGRVNWSLSRRLQLLAQVQRLAQSISVPGDVGNSCETAEYFHLEHVQSRIEKFRLDVAAAQQQTHYNITVEQLFPFKRYFSDTPAPLFSTSTASTASATAAVAGGSSSKVSGSGAWARDVDAAEGCFAHLNRIFEELADYRAFELLRTQSLRSDFLLTKQARIVAMTCTHAAMTRGRLVDIGFKYDSLVMEEAAQILEVETLIPMLLQDSDPVDGCRLKRVVLIGDHHQLPPVVKHQAFQKFAKLEQSMFTRFVRLGVPAVQLDQQGRARAEIAALYSWRYQQPEQHRQLGDLSNVLERPVFKTANAGFLHTFQFIDVPAFQGKGEICPTPYFYQNLGEAEYVVAVYQYMRLLGYPAEKISIITTYNGQKHLIRDIISQRCRNPLYGFPASISTVDKFQGQQNDYILLSMVRTESVGHIRDIRRLVVALSRARLGLYVFGRQRLFENCYELTTAFAQLLARATKLQLVAGEAFPTQRLVTCAPNASTDIDENMIHTVDDVTAMGVLVYQMVQQGQQQVLPEGPNSVQL